MGDPQAPPDPPGAPSTSGEARLRLADLEKYAGWLGRDARSSSLRASVNGLLLAFANDGDVVDALRHVQLDIDRLNSGGVTRLLRQTMRKLRAELGA